MSLLRGLAERASRGVVLRRRLPLAHGGARLYVSPESGGLRYWKPTLTTVDAALLRFVQQYVKTGARVFDVGANVGLLTVASAFHAGASGLVVAIDADIDNARLLQRTNHELDRSRHAQIIVLPAAVSGPGARVVRFAIAQRARSANAIEGFGSSQMGGVREVRHVPAITIDDLAERFGLPDVIKIDVEGAELGVIEGASTVLAKRRPVLHIEVAGENSDQVGDILRGYGYTFFDADRREPLQTALPAFSCLALPVGAQA